MKAIIHPLINYSGSIAAANTAQDVYTAESAPKTSFLFQNVSDTDMTIDFGTNAVVDKGILVPAGLAFPMPAGVLYSGRMSVICSVINKKFVCKVS